MCVYSWDWNSMAANNNEHLFLKGLILQYSKTVYLFDIGPVAIVEQTLVNDHTPPCG
jgi:hypothetical protein